MNDRVTPGAIVIGVLLIALLLMYVGWRRRQRRQSFLPRPQPVPADPGIRLFAVEALYVASTVADDPLNRIAVAGLGFRARAVVEVFLHGVLLGIRGEPDAFLPASDLVGVDLSTWTIDRVVERDGLVKITWRLGETLIDSYLRFTDLSSPGELIAAVDSIIVPQGAEGNEEQ